VTVPRRGYRVLGVGTALRMFANAILLSSFNNLAAIELLDLSLDLNISQQDCPRRRTFSRTIGPKLEQAEIARAKDRERLDQ